MAGIFRRANSSAIATVITGTRNRLRHDALNAPISDKIAKQTSHDYCSYQTRLPEDTDLPILGGQTTISNLTLSNRTCKCGTTEHYDIRTMHSGASKETRYQTVARHFTQHSISEVVQAV